MLTPNLDDPTGSTSVQAGEVRSQGVELSAVGKLTPELSIVGAYVFQNVKNTKANDETQGKWPVDIPRPRQMASLWADWTWRTGALEGFGLGAGVRYQSSAAGASDNSLKVPSYTVYDAGLHYEMPNWRFALNASNLFDRKYVSGCQSIPSACTATDALSWPRPSTTGKPPARAVQPARAASSRISSAPRSATIITAAWVLPDTILGMTEASTTRRPSSPFTRSRESVTASGSAPMRQVPIG